MIVIVVRRRVCGGVRQRRIDNIAGYPNGRIGGGNRRNQIVGHQSGQRRSGRRRRRPAVMMMVMMRVMMGRLRCTAAAAAAVRSGHRRRGGRLLRIGRAVDAQPGDALLRNGGEIAFHLALARRLVLALLQHRFEVDDIHVAGHQNRAELVRPLVRVLDLLAGALVVLPPTCRTETGVQCVL